MKRDEIAACAVTAAFAVMAIACAGLDDSSYSGDDGSVPYISINFKQSEGQVGYHMSNPLWGSWGYGSHSVSWSLHSLTLVSGSLPPGLRIDWDKIVGTPTQAGEWYLSFNYSITAKRNGQENPQSGSFNMTLRIRASGDFGGSDFSGTGTLDIVNQAPYEITVAYRGPQSGTVRIGSNGSMSLNLRAGNYSIEATSPHQDSAPHRRDFTLHTNERLKLTLFQRE
jgi:hypothetical protein